MSTSKMIVLKTSDDKIFEVEEAVALQSQTLANMVEDDCVGDEIPLADITSVTFTKVIEYCKKHVVVVVPDGDGDGDHGDGDGDLFSSSEEELKNWDAEFIRNIDQSKLFKLIMAANFLNVKGLLDLTCQAVADMISGKTPDEIRTQFDIVNDFTPEEEAQIRAENQWAFE